MSVAHHLEGFAWLAADRGEHERAAMLQGAADRMWQRSVREPRFGISMLHAERDRAELLARDSLGPEGYAQRYAAGAAMTTADAVAYALGESRSRRDASAGHGGGSVSGGAESGVKATPWDLLTAREREVAVLVADGLTNKDIAARLVVSKRTVDAHVEHILGKLGFTSRVQIAALATSQAPPSTLIPPQWGPRDLT